MTPSPDATPTAISTGTLDVSTGEGNCTATIESLGTTAADNCGGMNLVGTRSDGAPFTDPFPIGTTTIAWTAIHAAGNTRRFTDNLGDIRPERGVRDGRRLDRLPDRCLPGCPRAHRQSVYYAVLETPAFRRQVRMILIK